MHENGVLTEEAMSRGLAALKNFSNSISRHKAQKTTAIATSALREALNSREFIKHVKEETGLELKIISGEQEAALAAAGILMGSIPPETALMVDIGGGSTELIFTGNTGPLSVRSLNMGVVHLSDRYMKNDPPSNSDLRKMEGEITDRLMSFANPFLNEIQEGTKLIGTAGTITALAAMAQHLQKYEHDRIHNFRLTRDKVNSIYSDIAHITSEEREQHIPFEPARLDIIVPGTLILLKLMETFGFNELTVSNYGLREGILIDLYNSIQINNK